MAGRKLLTRTTLNLFTGDIAELKRRAETEKKSDALGSWQTKARTLLRRAIAAEAYSIWKFVIPSVHQIGLVKPAVIIEGIEVSIEAKADLGRRIPTTDIYVDGCLAVVVESSERKAREKLHRFAAEAGFDGRWMQVADVYRYDYTPSMICWHI